MNPQLELMIFFRRSSSPSNVATMKKSGRKAATTPITTRTMMRPSGACAATSASITRLYHNAELDDLLYLALVVLEVVVVVDVAQQVVAVYIHPDQAVVQLDEVLADLEQLTLLAFLLLAATAAIQLRELVENSLGLAEEFSGVVNRAHGIPRCRERPCSAGTSCSARPRSTPVRLDRH